MTAVRKPSSREACVAIAIQKAGVLCEGLTVVYLGGRWCQDAKFKFQKRAFQNEIIQARFSIEFQHNISRVLF